MSGSNEGLSALDFSCSFSAQGADGYPANLGVGGEELDDLGAISNVPNV
jgi:hypothetical protein